MTTTKYRTDDTDTKLLRLALRWVRSSRRVRPMVSGKAWQVIAEEYPINARVIYWEWRELCLRYVNQPEQLAERIPNL